MARRLRVASGGVAYHIINRRVGREPIFEDDGDYAAFEKVLAQAVDWCAGVRVVAYCLMPNHWHLVLWPRRDGELSRFMQWLTVTHMRRWHAHRGTAGTGPLYQGRFKSFPIQQDDHFLTVVRYVERNPLRARLVKKAQDWAWSSFRRRGEGPNWLLPAPAWPCPQPDNWEALVNAPLADEALGTVRNSVNRGIPFGDPSWQRRTALKLGLQSTLRPPWRPKKQGTATPGGK